MNIVHPPTAPEAIVVCDIHSLAERNTENGYEAIESLSPFDCCSYSTFGFLAGVRNYSAVTPISPPRGFPDDASAIAKERFAGWGSEAHTPSWLMVEELAAFDYDALTEDRRVTRRIAPRAWGNGGCTADEGEGKQMSYRDFLGEAFFRDLEDLKEAGAVRVVFWFDN